MIGRKQGTWICEPGRWPFQALLWLVWGATTLGAAAEWDTALRPNLITPEERRWLEAHPGIRVAPTADYQPVEYFDADGHYWGLTSEYFNLIEHRLGYRFQFVRLSHEQWQILDPEKRGADVIPASAETPRRAQFWSFTTPYLIFPTYIITRRSVEEEVTLKLLSGARVAVVQGWAAEDYLRRQYPGVVVDAVPDAATGLRKVSFGLVDAFVSELPVATAWMEQEGIANLQISGEAGYTYRLGISVRQDWPELHSILGKALATITPRERALIDGRWVKMKNLPHLASERWQRIVRWTGAGLLAVLVTVLAWNRALASQVRVRTAELHDELGRRIEAGLALRDSEEIFSKAFRSSPDAIFITRARDGHVIEANESAARIYACTKADLIGHRTFGEGWGWLSEADRQHSVALLRQPGGAVRDYEVQHRRKNGEFFTVLVSCETIELGGEPCVVGVARDVTKQRAAEAAVRGLVERFEMVARATNDAVWDWNLEAKSIWWYNGFQVLFGYRPDELESGIESWTNRLHPEDRERTAAGIYAVIDGGGLAWSDEYRFRRKDGSYAEIFDRGYVLRDGQGRAVRMIGAMQDITRRKEAERAIRESEKRYKDLFEANPHPMWVCDLETPRFLAVNAAAVAHYGYSREEFEQMTITDLHFHGDGPRPGNRGRPAGQGRDGVETGRHRKKDGSLIEVEITAHTLNFDGRQAAVVLAHDVTEQRRAEADRQQLFVQLLQAEAEERRRIARELHDTTAQHLAAIQMNLTHLREAAGPGPETQLLTDSLKLAAQSVQEIRTLTYLLHPPMLEELGLAGALEDYAAGFAQRSGIRVEVDATGYTGRLPRELELALFRVAQESLTNVLRHSGSNHALIRLERDADQVRLEVQDSGRGLPADAPIGVGLRGMKERLRQIDGELHIESDTEGTTVLASVPIPTTPG